MSDLRNAVQRQKAEDRASQLAKSEQIAHQKAAQADHERALVQFMQDCKPMCRKVDRLAEEFITSVGLPFKVIKAHNIRYPRGGVVCEIEIQYKWRRLDSGIKDYFYMLMWVQVDVEYDRYGTSNYRANYCLAHYSNPRPYKYRTDGQHNYIAESNRVTERNSMAVTGHVLYTDDWQVFVDGVAGYWRRAERIKPPPPVESVIIKLMPLLTLVYQIAATIISLGIIYVVFRLLFG